MSEIECKYKYQYIEKFNGEKYCLCFNDLCKNLAFACDKNCQIFEDYKQLQQAQEDIKQYSDWLDEAREDVEKAKKYNYNAGQELIRMSQELQQLKAENEKLKSDLQEETKLGHKAMCDEADMAWEVTKLQKCLDEIEDIAQRIPLTSYYRKQILQKIKQAKEGGE